MVSYFFFAVIARFIISFGTTKIQKIFDITKTFSLFWVRKSFFLSVCATVRHRGNAGIATTYFAHFAEHRITKYKKKETA